MQEITLFGVVVPIWYILPIVYLLWVLVLIFLKRMTYGAVQRFAKKTKSRWDDILIHASHFPLTLLIFTSGTVVVEQFLPLPQEAPLTQYVLIGFKAVTIVALVLFVERLTTGFLSLYGDKVERLKVSGMMAQTFARVIVISLGLLILLDSFGISITPIIASLGIGSLAVALALQPTLENFFAGIQILIDKPIQEGQFVQLDSGEQGYVHKIGWRSTWIRMLPNNVVVIPNKTLVNAKILNYDYPDTELAVLIEVGVHYASNLDHVERVTIEVACETLQEVSGGVKTFEPFIRYHTLGDCSIHFTVILRARAFEDNYLIKHEFIKRLLKRYNEEGIVIPYPIRAINYDQEKTAAPK